MSDSLTILGEDYTGVTGIKATDTSSGNTLIFVRPQGTKSITANGTGIDVAAYATADVSVSVSPNLQTKTASPSESTQAITADSGYDGLDEVDVAAIPSDYVGSGIDRRSSSNLTASGATVTAPAGYYASSASKSVASGTAGTPTATKGTVSNHSVSVTPSVTNQTGYITGSTKTGTAVSVAASELVSGTKSISANGTGIDVTNYASVDVAVPSSAPNLQAKTNIAPTTSSQTITADSGYDGLSSVQINAMPSMTLPTAASGTSSGTRKAIIASSTSTQYINIPTGYNSAAAYYQLSAPTAMTLPTTTSSTSSGTSKLAVTPGTENKYINIPTGYNSAAAYYTVNGDANLVAGNIKNGTTIFGVTGSYEGGGGSGDLIIATATSTPATASHTITFTGLSGKPTSFHITCQEDLTTASQVKVAAVAYDGTDHTGQTVTNTNNAQASFDDGFSHAYSNGTLTVTATTAYFQAEEYALCYTYGGGSANIGTEDVQVGSGATSITFTGLSDEPSCWSCVFTSNFSTSSGYTRVMAIVNDGSSTYGMEMGSGALATSNWTSSYSNGSLTIISQSTSAGGYFHQPGNYHLTYAVGGKVDVTVEPLTVTQNGVYSEAGKAYSPVTVSVSGGSVQFDTKTASGDSTYPTSLQFTSMKGEPKAFVLRLNAQVSSSGSTTYYYIVDICHFGTTTHGNCFRIGSTRRVENVTSGYSYSYNNGTLTVTSSAASRSASPGAFYNGSYELLYAY